MPTYNRAHLLERSVNSVVNQNFTDWELIIVDDGSSDETERVIKPFLVDSRIKYLKKDNSGAAHSRNVGIESATSKWITFLDSDDEAKLNWLERVIEVINENDPDLVCCGCETINSKGELEEVNLPISDKGLFGDLDYKMTNGGVFIVKRDLFLKVGGYDTELQSGQHTELSIRLIPYIQGIDGLIINIYESLIKIHIHLGERIRGNNKAKYLGSKLTLEKHPLFFNERRDLKSKYEGVVAYNASRIGLKKEGFKYSYKSFKTSPSMKRFLRIIKYSL